MMASTLRRKSQDALDRLWIRISVISVLSLIAIGVARVVRPILPDRIAETLGTDSLNDLLTIIASSMLAVVTFSLSVMVSVYRSSSSQWTPRVHRLMLEDRTTQNTLATFVGAYIFALAAIVLLRTSLFKGEDDDDDPQVVLFFFTILVLVLIVISIIRWILHLQRVGSLTDVTRRIESKAIEELDGRLAPPCLGGNCLDPRSIPFDAVAVTAKQTGYVQAIYPKAIAHSADTHQIDVYLHVPIGDFVHRGQPLCLLSQAQTELSDCVRENVVIGDLRTFEQDPQFGLNVLSEVASKALSTGVNDPGTAIDVIGRIARVLESTHSETTGQHVDLPRLWVAPLGAAELLEGAYEPIARDGADAVEVQIALQHALRGLAEHSDETLSAAAEQTAERLIRRCEEVLESRDAERLREIESDDRRPKL